MSQLFISHIQHGAVTCSLYAPPECIAGAPYVVQIWLHDPAQSEEVMARATEFDSDARPKGSVTTEEFPLGTPLRFSLEVPGLPVELWDTEERTWDGHMDAVNFLINVPEETRKHSVVGIVRVFRENVPVGSLKLMVKIKREEQAKIEPPAQPLLRYRKAYISYASEDWEEVLRRVQVLYSAGLSIFMDGLTWEPGQDWKAQIYRMIDEADAFYLFWSEAAARSEQVRKEVLYALERQRHSRDKLPEIIPVVLSVPAPPPPRELAHLHFDNRFGYLIKAEELKKNKPLEKSSGEE